MLNVKATTFAMFVLACCAFAVSSNGNNGTAQDKYKIDGKEIEATFVKLDGAKAVLKPTEGKEIEVTLFNLQSNELHQIFVVLSEKVKQAKKANQFFSVLTDDDRKWVVDGNSVRAQFQDIQEKSIYLGGPGMNQFEAKMDQLRRTDLIWVLRHVWDELEKEKKENEKDKRPD